MPLRIHRKATQYIFFEMIPGLLIGLTIFIFIMLLFQALRLTEFVLVHGVSLGTLAEMIGYMAISFLPALLPMALLFAVLMTYGRLSQDSEIVALKASGLSMWAIMTPAIILSLVMSLFSAQITFHLAPWGNRQFEVLFSRLLQTKTSISLREGTFSEGFFDLVVYANEVDSKSGRVKKVFIYDERRSDAPLTIVAREGEILQQGALKNIFLLRLEEGNIHRKTESHTKINFETFDLKLIDPVKEELKAKSPPSMSIEEIQEKRKNSDLSPKEARSLTTEFHKRWAIAVVCLIFGVLGVGLGTTTNRRQQKSNGLILSLGVVVVYWILYLSSEGLARSGSMPPAIAMWIPNLFFSGFSVWILKRNWN